MRRDEVARRTQLTTRVCNICIGAFGIQFGFALPQANATRIFQNLGATLESPITGLIIQPLVGYYRESCGA